VTLDDLDLFPAPGDPRPGAAPARRCHRHLYILRTIDHETVWACERCGKHRDAAVSRRSRGGTIRGTEYSGAITNTMPPDPARLYSESGSVAFRSTDGMSRPTDPADRFWSHVDKSGECWEWTGRRLPHGYGRFDYGRITLAHRVAWTLENGPIPAGLVVMHRCDNPPCVRPAHLRTGTMADNQRDMAHKGRAATGDRNGSRLYPRRDGPWAVGQSFGESNGQAKLTADQVLEMRASGLKATEIARKYGISKAQASRILARTRWAHV
jgi:hypothetical protein